MSFFDAPPPVPERPAPPKPERAEWVGPPRGVLAGVSTQQAVLCKTDRVLLMVHRFLAYATGVEFTLDFRMRHPDRDRHAFEFRGPLPPTRSRPEGALRFGLLLSDGTRWTNLLHQRPRGPEEPPEPPVVIFRSGGGGGESWAMEYWLWPLPPAGPLTLVVEWPAFGVPETRAVIDATELRERALESEAIWPD